MTWAQGDAVEWESLNSRFVFRGVIEGFFGKDGVMAMCTDQTGRRSRPVKIERLRRPTTDYWYRRQAS